MRKKRLSVRGVVLVLGTVMGMSTLSSAATVQVNSVDATPGAEAQVCVNMYGSGDVAGLQMDLSWDPNCMSISTTKKQCVVNRETGKALHKKIDGATLRAILVSFSDTEPIPDGNLFCCNFVVSDSPPGAQCAVTVSQLVGSDPMGSTRMVSARTGRSGSTAPAVAVGGGGGSAAAPAGGNTVGNAAADAPADDAPVVAYGDERQPAADTASDTDSRGTQPATQDTDSTAGAGSAGTAGGSAPGIGAAPFAPGQARPGTEAAPDGAPAPGYANAGAEGSAPQQYADAAGARVAGDTDAEEDVADTANDDSDDDSRAETDDDDDRDSAATTPTVVNNTPTPKPTQTRPASTPTAAPTKTPTLSSGFLGGCMIQPPTAH